MDKLFAPPPALNMEATNLKEEWEMFEQGFDLFITATDSADKPEPTRVAMFLSAIGADARRVFNSFTFSAEVDKKKLDKVKDKFRDYCTPRKNEVFERYRFFELSQAPGESIDSFAAALRLRAKDCGFGDQTESLIRDRIVFGCSDARMKERLLREDNLTLKSALDICRASEASKSQMKVMKSESASSSSSVAAAAASGRHSNRRPPSTNSDSCCRQCGSPPHDAVQTCPAKNQTCRRCGKSNHFARMCRSKPPPVQQQHQQSSHQQRRRSRSRSRRGGSRDSEASVTVVADSVSDLGINDCFIGAGATSNIDAERSWWETVLINNSQVRCKLDSGAEGNVMSVGTFNELKESSKLRPTKVRLFDFANRRSDPLGVAKLTVRHKDREHQLDFFVVAGSGPTLLSCLTCSKLNLLQRVDSSLQSKPTLSTDDLLREFADVFDNSLGCLPGQHHISVDPTVSPVIHALRKVPLAIQPKLKQLLDSYEEKGIIMKRDEPTEWVSSLLCVEKKDGSLRVCLDPKDLNRAIQREHYAIPTFDDVSAKLCGKSLFSVIDMKDGFWQVMLDEESSRLCTFNTPFGRYSFCRLPFGVSSAPEVFEKKVTETFGDIDGVHIIFDDMIVAAIDEEDHDRIFRALLERARAKQVKFNKSKLQLKVKQARYCGHLLTPDGVKADPDKVKAIQEMPAPTDAKGVQRFIGMVNYLSKFVPGFSSVTEPLRSLQKTGVEWTWTSVHQQAFETIKKKIASAPILRFFDPAKPIVIQTDSSSTGLGSCLLQDGLPVSYASRALTDAERRYAQIEKELLAIVFACERFHFYVYGRDVMVQSDHRPLESIFRKSLHQTTPRLQRMLLRLLRYRLTVQYTPGKLMFVADTLSRAYLPFKASTDEQELADDIDVLVHSLLSDYPASVKKMDQLREETASDPELSQLLLCLRNGFEKGDNLPQSMQHYKKFADDMYELDGLLFVHGRLIVPTTMRPYILQLIHEGHLGMDKCKTMARRTLYWPNMTRDIENLIAKCSVCNSFRRQQAAEPLLAHPVPDRPWQKVGVDLFSFKQKDYILVVDYYSKYPEISRLPDKTASTVIMHLKDIFARHGIPEQLFSDNMPFNSRKVHEFADEWRINLTTSSPRYAQSNGQAERAIQTVKSILRKADEAGTDPYVALLQYRNTPITGCDYSPAQMLFSRSLRTKLPLAAEHLIPEVVAPRGQLSERQQQYKKYFDRNTKALMPLHADDVIRVKHDGEWLRGRVLRPDDAPRSYVVECEEGSTLRRNRRDLIKTAEETPVCAPFIEEPSLTQDASSPSTLPPPRPPPSPLTSASSPSSAVRPPPPILKTTRRGRVVQQPVRFADYDMSASRRHK